MIESGASVDEQLYQQLQREVRRIARQGVASTGGTIFDESGDTLGSRFADVDSALEFALALGVEAELAAARHPMLRASPRTAVVVGDAYEDDGVLSGRSVVRAGRILKVCTASGRPEGECRKWYDEDKEAKSIEKDIAARVHPLPDIPITEVSAMHLDDCSTVPGKDLVSYEAAGVVVTAPDCEALATKIAEKNFRDWRQLGPQVRELRVQATHDGLISEAGPEIIKIINGILRR